MMETAKVAIPFEVGQVSTNVAKIKNRGVQNGRNPF